MRPNRLFDFVSWAYLAGMLAWYGLRLRFFDHFWWLALLNTSALYLFVPLLLLLPLALWRCNWPLVAGLALPCVLFGAWFGPLLLPKTAPSSAGSTITVVSFNLLWSNQDYEKVRAMARASQADVIGLQELRLVDTPALFAALAADYPYHVLHTGDFYHTVALVSRFPLEEVRVFAAPPLERGLEATVVVGGRPIDLLVTHLAPNNMPFEWPGQFAADTGERYRTRAAEVSFIQHVVAQRTRPIIMLCDCNLSDTSEAYARLASSLNDSFRMVGWGLGHTLLNPLLPFPVQRIDYVWATNELQPLTAYVGPAAGSDHLPVVARLGYVPAP
ncbi:MAG: endonuclease/exonuclease/phosphatase family protein [Chloroflexaceae bacterium]|nr:endonuclease/exonuclease/phosphatase family protein [Chloroflexaceae bacterium]